MAFVFTVEDGSGVAGANSYCSVAFADDYFELDIHSSDWSSATEANRRKSLAWATSYVDLFYKFSGRKTDEDNPLEFPRIGVPNVDSDEIPPSLCKAVAEAAKAYLVGDVDLSGSPDVSEVTILETIKVKASGSGNDSNGIPSLVGAYLAPLLGGGSNVHYFQRG